MKKQNEVLTRDQVLKILESHGLTSSQLTATKGGYWLDYSSFDAEMKIRPEYTKTEVYAWLGY